MRFDVPLAAGRGDEARRFERAWRAELAAQGKTALAMPPARAVSARFRVVGPEAQPELGRYLRARLAALPGGPAVLPEEASPASPLRPDWTGVQVWLAYPAADLPALLRTPKTAKTNTKLRKRNDRTASEDTAHEKDAARQDARCRDARPGPFPRAP